MFFVERLASCPSAMTWYEVVGSIKTHLYRLHMIRTPDGVAGGFCYFKQDYLYKRHQNLAHELY